MKPFEALRVSKSREAREQQAAKPVTKEEKLKITEQIERGNEESKGTGTEYSYGKSKERGNGS